jgi:hypothetical protein
VDRRRGASELFTRFDTGRRCNSWRLVIALHAVHPARSAAK